MDRFIKPPTEPSAYPDAQKTDSTYRVQNWAKTKPETVKKFLETARMHAAFFLGQGARSKQENDRLKDADAMYRMAMDQTKQDENKTPGTTDTIPHVFFTSIRMITANECDAMFHQGELPMKYAPLEYQTDAQLAEARITAQKQNLTLEYSFEADKRKPKIKESVGLCNKYGNEVTGMEWFYSETTIRERQVTKNSEGKSTLVWKTITEIKEHPSFFRIDIKDVLFDVMIDDFQRQQCLIFRRRPLLHELRKGQADGHYVNLEKLADPNAQSKYLYQGETPSWVLADRQTNADETADAYSQTGAYDEKLIWMRAPIDKDGKWDEEGTFPEWHMCRILGCIDDTEALCLELKKNPYNCGLVPYKLQHSMPDDKGAFHMGYVDIIRPTWNEYKTTLDQWFHAKNLNMNAPWMEEEGAILNQDKSFGPNKLLLIRRGYIERVKRMDIKINTQDMQAFLGYLEAKVDNIMATEKAYRGEAMGSRTSAGEAKNAFDQSMKPGAEKMRYISEQYFEWMAFWDRELWRQFGHPDHVVAVLGGPAPQEVKPAWIEGPLRVKLQCVDSFEDNLYGIMEFDRMLQVALPAIVSMGGKTLERTLHYAFKRHKIPTDEIFTATKDSDAKMVQWGENLGFIHGIWSDPQEGQDHDAHEAVVASGLELYKTSWAEPDSKVVAMFMQHALMHKQLREREQMQSSQRMQTMQGLQAPQQQQATPAGMGSAETAPTTEGAAIQNMLGASEGGMA